MTYEEEEQLLEYLAERGEHDMLDLFCVLFDTGMTFSEANKLTYRDVDLEQEMITVWINKGNTKGNKSKQPFMLNYYHVYWVFGKFKKHIGLAYDDELVIHTTRHTTASCLVQKDVPLQVVRDILGHASIKMTERYARLSPSRLKSTISILDKKILLQQRRSK